MGRSAFLSDFDGALNFSSAAFGGEDVSIRKRMYCGEEGDQNPDGPHPSEAPLRHQRQQIKAVFGVLQSPFLPGGRPEIVAFVFAAEQWLVVASRACKLSRAPADRDRKAARFSQHH